MKPKKIPVRMCIACREGKPKKELIRLIEVFLDSLKQEDRVMFIRRYWFADSVLEIASRMRMTPNNVSVRLARTRKKLQVFLERSGY